jgi:hypothetical protein
VKKNSAKPGTRFRGRTQLFLCSRGGISRATKSNASTSASNNVDGTGGTRQQRQPKQQSAITECPWEIWTEETTAGWVVSIPTERAIKYAMESEKNNDNVCLCHNHDLVTTDLERLAFPALREIPIEIVTFANNLHEAGGYTPSQLYRALVSKCRKDGYPVTFTQIDIKNKYGTKHSDAILD